MFFETENPLHCLDDLQRSFHVFDTSIYCRRYIPQFRKANLTVRKLAFSFPLLRPFNNYFAGSKYANSGVHFHTTDFARAPDQTQLVRPTPTLGER